MSGEPMMRELVVGDRVYCTCCGERGTVVNNFGCLEVEMDSGFRDVPIDLVRPIGGDRGE